MIRAVIVAFVLLGRVVSYAHDFVAVFFDVESARELQADAPLPRDLVARVIHRCKEAEARGLVLKFFYDLPSDREKDEAMAKALCSMPTALQAGQKSDGTTNALPERFRIAKGTDVAIEEVMWSDRGYIPLPIFSKCARGIGFVDLERTDAVPLVEAYQQDLVKSLYVSALELELRETAIYKGTNVTFGARSLWFDARGEHPIKALPKLDYIPFHRILNSSAPLDELKNKVVILGYTGRRIHSIRTKWGEIEAHRLFVQCLLALTEDLRSSKP